MNTKTLNDLIGDPWRCVCPECYSWHIVKREDTSKPRVDQRKVGNDYEKTFRCDECHERLSSVFDRKQRKIVPIQQVLDNAEA